MMTFDKCKVGLIGPDILSQSEIQASLGKILSEIKTKVHCLYLGLSPTTKISNQKKISKQVPICQLKEYKIGAQHPIQ